MGRRERAGRHDDGRRRVRVQERPAGWCGVGDRGALYALTPAPVVALNRAVALAEVRGPAAGLAAVDQLRSSGLDSYYLFQAFLDTRRAASAQPGTR